MTVNDPKDDPKYQVGGKQYKLPYERDVDYIDPRTVEQFHEKADTDSSQSAAHHTLGSKNGQAAAGDHNHITGTPYKKPLAGMTISGSRGGNAALPSIIDCLEKLGATDTTTA